MNRKLTPALVLIAALSLGGCTAVGESGSGSLDGPAVGVPVAPEAGSDGGGTGGGDEEGGGDSAGDLDTDADRSIVTTGTMTITSADPLDAAADATRIVEGDHSARSKRRGDPALRARSPF